MAEVVGVVFRGGVKVYNFDPAGLELSRGDRVVVQTMSGAEIGQVVEPPHIVDDSEIPAPLKRVVRVATGEDLETLAASDDLRKEAMEKCRELITSHGLDMKLVDAEIGFGGEKITFSFFAEERVDFRALVADLAKTLKMRIELRQVGAREEARMVGGLGPCGRGLCCATFPGDDDPVSIRMAKEQNLPLNPMKISGLCGRLMCCLKYEQEQYVRFRKEAPAKGTPVSTPGGEGVVAGYSLTKEAITVRLESGSMTDVRLAACQCQDDGGLVVVPEVKAVPFVPAPEDTSGLQALATADGTGDELTVVEAEVITGEDGEPVEVIVAESSRRSRGRRGRGRRKGKGRAQAPTAQEETGGAGESKGEPAATTPGGGRGSGSDEGRSGGQRKTRRSGRQSGQRSRKQADSGGKTGGTAGGGEQSDSSARTKSRRRRGARGSGGGRAGKAAGDGAGESSSSGGSGGDVGGSAGSGSGGSAE